MVRGFKTPVWLVAAGLIAAQCVGAPTIFAADGLQKELADIEVAGRWIYDDWAAAQEQARRDKKPIFALFR